MGVRMGSRADQHYHISGQQNLGCNDKDIRKSKFVTKTQFLYNFSLNIFYYGSISDFTIKKSKKKIVFCNNQFFQTLLEIFKFEKGYCYLLTVTFNI